MYNGRYRKSRGATLGLLMASMLAIAAAPPALADEAVKLPTCATLASPVRVDGGIVAISSLKRWQPRGGAVSFAVKSTKGIPTDATVLVCFRWEKKTGKPQEFIEGPPAHITAVAADRSITLAATVPDNLLDAPPRFLAEVPANEGADGGVGVYEGFMFVPMADVRILIFDPKGTIVVDAIQPIGVTSSWWAAIVGIGVAAIALILLSLVRLWQGRNVGAFLRLIATPGGYASLSQFQIMLWTLVVGGSAAYVMALSGELIPISPGTLVLLGISGAATLGSKLQSAREDAATAAQPPAAAVQPVPPAPATPPTPPAPRNPAWSDLVVADGQIDVTRVQMLFFTLVTAAFVVLKVATGYEIPQIPAEFQTLMGLSNGVYMGSKFIK